ncbi:MAG TPA: hypothetical protein VJP78_09670 [Thermoleophilia bacterium]|nr:hypothetical protein [Thermoleophilia bacterium]
MLQQEPLPPFDLNGNLPDGVYACDEATFQERFVTAFPKSRTRALICEGFLRWMKEAARAVEAATQWVDGSFVSENGGEDPKDVDVVTFYDRNYLNRLNEEATRAIRALLDGGTSTKPEYHTHTILVACCGTEDPYYPVFESSRLYWRTWFGKTRDIPDPPGPDRPGNRKGIVEMTIGDAKACPVISHERSNP